MRLKFSPARRRASFLGALALLGVLAAPTAAAALAAMAAPPVRLAFLVGNREDQPDLAARFEVCAREPGFTPPPSLEQGK